MLSSIRICCVFLFLLGSMLSRFTYAAESDTPIPEHKSAYLARLFMHASIQPNIPYLSPPSCTPAPRTQGTLLGPNIKGKIMHRGSYQEIHTSSGLTLVRADYLIKMDDNSVVHLKTKGVVYPLDSALSNPKESCRPLLSMGRFSLSFKTSSSKYKWLNQSQAIAYAHQFHENWVYDSYLVGKKGSAPSLVATNR